MKLSVAICTWNRADMLAEMLEHLTLCNKPVSAEWEVVVVNNNCTDHTDAVIKSFVGRLPIVRVWQPIPGKSNALNAAMQAVTGDYILWTDDDVLVDENWIRTYEAAIRSNPDAVFFGGPIRPHYDIDPPQWLRESIDLFASAYALRELGDHPIDLDKSTLPFGANWAVRVREQRNVAYDPRLGRQPAEITLCGEETQVMEQLLAEGARGVWVPDAFVNHRVPALRQTVTYLKKYYRGLGMTDRVLDQSDPVSQLFGRPRWMLKAVVVDAIRYFSVRCMGDIRQWGPAFILLNTRIGYLSKGKGRKDKLSEPRLDAATTTQSKTGSSIAWFGAGGRHES